MLRKWRSLIALALIALVAACTTARSPQATITVGAAADLQYAFEELGKQFEQETGTNIDFTFGSTGQLAQQIERGAPIDLYAAANQSYVENLDKKGRVISNTKAVYGQGRLVLWVREDSPVDVEAIQFEDLLDAKIKRVAIANPEHAPYGVAAKEALQTSGIWEKIQPKLVLGENVRQTLQYAETGNVDIAIVALSLAVVVPGKYKLVSDELHNPLNQMLAVVAGSAHEREARAFADFISSETGRSVMQRYGFILPGEEPVK